MQRARLLILALLFVLHGCAVSRPNLPAITEEATGARLAGKIVWHDLITHTPDASKRFYRELFGWEFQELSLDFAAGRTVNYSLIRHRGELIGGLVDANQLNRSDASQLSQWVVVMSVADVESAVTSVEDAGGRVLTPPTDVAARGRLALIEDDQGAALALLRTRDGDPADSAVPVGGFLWDEVWPDDVERSIAFYARRSGLTADSVATPNGGDYRFMNSSGTPRFGFLERPIEWIEPTWVSYVRVDEVSAVLSRVSDLGGEVLVPEQDRAGERVALIADPSGAGIAIQTWSASSVAGSNQQ